MKKLTVLLALLLVFAVMASLYGCSDSEPVGNEITDPFENPDADDSVSDKSGGAVSDGGTQGGKADASTKADGKSTSAGNTKKAGTDGSKTTAAASGQGKSPSVTAKAEPTTGSTGKKLGDVQDTFDSKEFLKKAGECRKNEKKNSNGEVVSVEYINDKGEIVLITEYENGEVLVYNVRYYDSVGNLLRWVVYDSEGKLSNSEDHNYNSDGWEISDCLYDMNGNISMTTLYEYDEKGNLLKETDIDGSGDLLRYSVYKYAKGVMSAIIDYDSKGKVINKTEF